MIENINKRNGRTVWMINRIKNAGENSDKYETILMIFCRSKMLRKK